MNFFAFFHLFTFVLIFFKTYDDCPDLLKKLQEGGKTGREYDPDVRSFALTLHFYSPRAIYIICVIK